MSKTERNVDPGYTIEASPSIARALSDVSGARLVALRSPDGTIDAYPSWTDLSALAGALAGDEPTSAPVPCGRFVRSSAPEWTVLYGFADTGDGPTGERLDALARVVVLLRWDAVRTVATDAAQLSSVGEIVSGIAHDIGTPLNVISGYAESILMTTPEEAPGRKQVTAILDQTRRIAGMVRQMLDIVRPSPEYAGGKQPMDRFVADVVQISSHMLRRQSVRSRCEDGAPGLVGGDLPRLQQAMFGMLRGVAQIAGARSQITVRPEQSDRGAGLAIEAVDGTHAAVDLSALVTPPLELDALERGLLFARRVLAEHGGAVENLGGDSFGLFIRLGEKSSVQ